MSIKESAYVRPTFTKLPSDKKERIVDVAIDEFSRCGSGEKESQTGESRDRGRGLLHPSCHVIAGRNLLYSAVSEDLSDLP